jgi:hypothetical protein
MQVDKLSDNRGPRLTGGKNNRPIVDAIPQVASRSFHPCCNQRRLGRYDQPPGTGENSLQEFVDRRIVCLLEGGFRPVLINVLIIIACVSGAILFLVLHENL